MSPTSQLLSHIARLVESVSKSRNVSGRDEPFAVQRVICSRRLSLIPPIIAPRPPKLGLESSACPCGAFHFCHPCARSRMSIAVSGGAALIQPIDECRYCWAPDQLTEFRRRRGRWLQAKCGPSEEKCRALFPSGQCGPSRNIRWRTRDSLQPKTRHRPELRCGVGKNYRAMRVGVNQRDTPAVDMEPALLIMRGDARG